MGASSTETSLNITKKNQNKTLNTTSYNTLDNKSNGASKSRWELCHHIHPIHVLQLKYILKEKHWKMWWESTFIRSYSRTATFFASSVVLMVSFNCSNFWILDLSPPNTLDDAASSFSALVCNEDKSDNRVCSVSKALERSENAPWTASISPR